MLKFLDRQVWPSAAAAHSLATVDSSAQFSANPKMLQQYALPWLQTLNAVHSCRAAVMSAATVGHVCMVAQMAGAMIERPASLSDG